MYIRVILWKRPSMFCNCTVVNLIDSSYTNAHEELYRHEIGCHYALAMGAYRENLKYRVYNQYKMVGAHGG